MLEDFFIFRKVLLMNGEKETIYKKIKDLVIGKARNPEDPKLFHKLSLIAFFAWVGFGSDGISSSCYGPEEAFLALGSHMFLGIFVAILTAITIFAISSSYQQIIELFPSGGGGYLVASKLLSPNIGMVSGCALLIDYVLTITISIASGADALFSFLPPEFYSYKIIFAILGIAILTVLNMRGVKESVIPLVPIFLAFIITHAFAILYVFFTHASDFQGLASNTINDAKLASNELGLFGMIFLVLKAYSMGAGTFTGIEAVSNGIPILREPRVQTAKKTMRYMSISLAFMAAGLMIGYLLFRVTPIHGKTLNAIFFENVTANWVAPWNYLFIFLALLSESVLLFFAAQTGFFGGPRVLANMAQDRWFPSRFAILSERFVIHNGILLMGIAALVIMIGSKGSVKFLVILYSINVFITFLLSQLGMVRYWWDSRKKISQWKRKIFVSGTGLTLTAFILFSVIILKFHEGGWITIFITSILILLAILVKRHYNSTFKLFKRLDNLISVTDDAIKQFDKDNSKKAFYPPQPDLSAKTAVILISGYNGPGLHTLFNVLRLFGGNFKNFIFVHVGVMDAGNFKGKEEIESLKVHVDSELAKYIKFMHSQGYYAEALSGIGTDVVEETTGIAYQIFERFPNAVFFGGQVVFPKDTFFTRFLHNYTTFAIQRKLYQEGIPFLLMPLRVS